MEKKQKAAPESGMKVLSIAWYKILPAKFGGQKGIASFNKYLAEHCSLVCLCSRNNESPVDLPYKILPELPINKWQFINPPCWRKIKDVAKQEKASHIILEHPYHAIAAYKAKKAINAKLILHAHNIESERFREAGKWWWRLLKRYEKWAHRKADLILFKTEADRNYSITHFKVDSEKCSIMPYGIEQTSLPNKETARQLVQQRHHISQQEKIILFAGTLDYEPNAIAVEKIYTTIALLLAREDFPFKIIICGRNNEASFQYLKKLFGPNITYAGERDDIENYFMAADVFINPVQSGGGIQTKNIDALAYHCNVVCFENMIEKETIDTAKDKIYPVIQGDWPVFVQQVKKAANHIIPTPTSFFELYEWQNIIDRLMNRLNAI